MMPFILRLSKGSPRTVTSSYCSLGRRVFSTNEILLDCGRWFVPSKNARSRVMGVTASGRLERETGFEPATSSLARKCSTTELLPLAMPAARCWC